LQKYSHMDGMSSPADRDESEELQTSRGIIIVVLLDDIADVMAHTGVAREMIRTQRINMLIFLIGQM